MRRVILLTLLAVALPTAALANSIDFSTNQTVDFTTGRFEMGTVTREPSGNFAVSNFMVSVTGTLGTINISNIHLTPGCNTNGSGTCMFSSGTVTVLDTSGATVFTDSLSNGMIIKTSNGATITATMLPNAMDPSGGVVSYTLSFAPGPHATNSLIGGTGFATGSSGVIPEPGTLGLLGTGVIGLAGMMRRKIRPWAQ